MSIRTHLLSLYPKAWRERYGVEFETLLEDTGLSPHLVGDVVIAALGARVAQLWRRPRRLPLGPREGGGGMLVAPFAALAFIAAIAAVVLFVLHSFAYLLMAILALVLGVASAVALFARRRRGLSGPG